MSVTLGIVSVSQGRLNLREKPSKDSEIIAKLTKGTAVQISDSSGSWLRVEVGALSGFVHQDFIIVQDERFFDQTIRSLDSNFSALSPARQSLVEQALKMLGTDVVVFDSLPEAQQRDCWGWNFRNNVDDPHHKDIVCADLVYICLKASGVDTEWEIHLPQNTIFNTHHAANYFRPSDFLQEVNEAENWEVGDILIYWDGDMNQKRIRHVNLYIGSFAGMDLDGFIYSADDPCDVVNASIDFRDKSNKERGTRIRGVKKERCLISKFSRKHCMRLRHVELF